MSLESVARSVFFREYQHIDIRTENISRTGVSWETLGKYIKLNVGLAYHKMPDDLLHVVFNMVYDSIKHDDTVEIEEAKLVKDYIDKWKMEHLMI
jgi:hypothetical protein